MKQRKKVAHSKGREPRQFTNKVESENVTESQRTHQWLAALCKRTAGNPADNTSGNSQAISAKPQGVPEDLFLFNLFDAFICKCLLK